MNRISLTDLKRTTQLVLLTPVAWLLPEHLWPTVCDLVTKLSGALSPGRRRAFERTMPSFLTMGDATAREASLRVVSAGHQEVVTTLRARRPGGWHPKIDLVGRERLEDALAAQHGAILWLSAFEFAYLVSKMAFYEAGYRLSHLSRPQHGFSNTAFGRRFLNPIQTGAERRFLADRIVMPPSGVTNSLRTIHERLRLNGIVSITVTPNAGQILTLPFFDETIRLPVGPVTLARSTQAALFPVFTRRLAPGEFEVCIEPALDTSGPRGDTTPFQQYVRLLESHIGESPASWRGWMTGSLDR